MKQFIVLLAVIPLMFVFLFQFTLEQKNAQTISLMTDIVYAAKEEAKQKGGFDEDALRTELSTKLGINENDIIIDVPAEGSIPRINKDGSRGIIQYKVVIPIKTVYAGRSYLGIKDDTSYGYKLESAAPSEYLP